jgi:putative hydrolase of the HAD superfamily
VRKPEPEIYRRALTRLSEAVGRPIEATDCAYLDDLGINLKPARELGFATIKVVDPGDALAELSALVGFPLDGRA